MSESDDLKVCIDCGLVECEDKEHPNLDIDECDGCAHYCCAYCNIDCGNSGDYCFRCYTRWVARMILEYDFEKMEREIHRMLRKYEELTLRQKRRVNNRR